MCNMYHDVMLHMMRLKDISRKDHVCVAFREEYFLFW